MNAPSFANPIFVALDTPDLSRALAIARAVKPHVGGLKVGLEFITALGPDGVRKIVEVGLPVFVDMKFHDIPNTVAGAARSIAMLGVAMFNVHASGGEAMMRAAMSAIVDIHPRPLLLAVTVLTSLDDSVLDSVGQRGPSVTQVERLAALTKSCGLDGVVCSAHEIAAVRKAAGAGFLTVVPGIRPAGSAFGDQRRVMTPSQALAQGADILVIGRPITGASDPAGAAQAVAQELVGTIA
jgi:orotidine-5'-phosphate decarboxylase